jgi:hypothetical protein
MADPKALFGKVPEGAFVEEIGDLKVGTVVERGNSKVMISHLQVCNNGDLIAYYDYECRAQGCSYLHPNGRFRL